ncbi:palmitoyl-CoA hydrolase, partial [Streptomyces sp. A1136]
STLNITVSPADDLIDVPRRIVVTGAQPGELVQVASRTVRAGAVWRSSARFVADTAGHVDLTLAPAVEGDYAGISAMGLLWSQAPEQPGRRELFHADVLQPLTTSLEASGASGKAEAELIQRLSGDGVTRREVREQGLVGTLFLPAGPGPHPAVMILNGSGGGINEPRAAL